MAKDVKFRIANEDGSDLHDISANFEDHDLALFDNFLMFFEDLTKLTLFQNRQQMQVTVNFHQDKGLNISTQLPPEENLFALLLQLRPFILESEPTYFYSACNKITKHISNSKVRELIKAGRNLFSGERSQKIFIIQSDTMTINSEKIFYKWLNAYVYHREIAKRQELEAVHNVLPIEVSRAIFIMMLFDKMDAIRLLADFLKVLLHKSDGKSKVFVIRL